MKFIKYFLLYIEEVKFIKQNFELLTCYVSTIQINELKVKTKGSM